MTSENKRPLPEAIRKGLMDPKRWEGIPQYESLLDRLVKTFPPDLIERVVNDIDSMYQDSNPPTREQLEKRLEGNTDITYVTAMKLEYNLRMRKQDL
ncbi:hypothetical protein CO038_02175 [Candidatus Pacearchaeota archaeon CG_4_9_14_0_2_um_filter_39_13]|nr:hypothetical protein [Candidatus Pacearchaeota archaeon]OIO43903.1 MAG: hypothetical protein AUJ64_01230 [Candidatus Pacearchaeota archaeon CG1_02_39_14]PJC44752.1 MAG: hypothetical protein CO038_02175 [Candidatus Pacearchaeota archaeon CG_4_9_14_0_2_um_filter_39_13]